MGASFILGEQKCRTTLTFAMVFLWEWGFDIGDRKPKNSKISGDGAAFMILGGVVVVIRRGVR